ncbi:methyltransferase domain-containing protein [Shewanella aquimarina]|uniref:methyltransferase domain-containing protein n=1 Tax=Shewanella aquimarina TaxID=260365 RepID=UPI002014D141|nr:methyltransferase domain-containing protein [Shewanella aquimarina]
MCSELAKDVPTNMPSQVSKAPDKEGTSVVSPVSTADVDKIAGQFSQAARHYQEHDKVQRLSAQRLRASMSPVGRLLDIGCGPGTDFSTSPQLTQVIGLDIAPGMLTQMQSSFPAYQALCGDAQALPLSDASIDTLYSNLALQWCSDIKTAIGELARVLKPGGQCHLAIVVDGSLAELDALGLRVNAFEAAQTVLYGFSDNQWQIEHQTVEALRVHFDDLKTLLYSIKGVGASTATGVNDQPSVRLRGRRDWQSLCERVEAMRQPEGLPLTYQILFIHASRKAS